MPRSSPERTIYLSLLHLTLPLSLQVSPAAPTCRGRAALTACPMRTKKSHLFEFIVGLD
jgi:hypothetical protein